MRLDKNRNYQLQLKEVQEFLRKTKRKIHPKKCSKTFVGFCDKDKDSQLSLFEWYSCFGVQGMYHNTKPFSELFFQIQFHLVLG